MYQKYKIPELLRLQSLTSQFICSFCFRSVEFEAIMGCWHASDQDEEAGGWEGRGVIFWSIDHQPRPVIIDQTENSDQQCWMWLDCEVDTSSWWDWEWSWCLPQLPTAGSTVSTSASSSLSSLSQDGEYTFHFLKGRYKHHKNCECCPMSLLGRPSIHHKASQRLSIVILCNQCLNGHRSLLKGRVS